MTNDLPLRFDPVLFARQDRRFAGKIAIKDMPRLVGTTPNPESKIYVTMSFSASSLQFPLVKGTIEGQVVQTCQRCLGETMVPVNESFALLLVTSDSVELATQEGHEIFEYSEQFISTIDLIEDEVLLAMPIVAKHEILEECNPVAQKWIKDKEYTPEDNEPESPFAKLKDLTRR